MPNLDLKSPAAQRFVLTLLLAGGALGLYFGSRLTPWTFPSMQDRLAETQAQYEKKSAELARARASVADLPRFEAEYQQLHQRWELASELLPTDRQLPALLRRITLAGQQTGVTFKVFRPEGVKPSDYHTEMPINVSVSGDYHAVGSFLAELANMRRIVTVSNLKLATNNRSEDAGTTIAEFTASAYSLNTAPATQPGAATPKGGAHARKS